MEARATEYTGDVNTNLSDPEVCCTCCQKIQVSNGHQRQEGRGVSTRGCGCLIWMLLPSVPGQCQIQHPVPQPPELVLAPWLPTARNHSRGPGSSLIKRTERKSPSLQLLAGGSESFRPVLLNLCITTPLWVK